MTTDDIVSKLRSTMSEDDKVLLDTLVKSGVDLKEADSDGDGVPDVKGMKALFFKNGKFSKTATFAVLANIIVLVNYFFMSWLAGSEIPLPWFVLKVPVFDAADAAAILAILNGTYLANHKLAERK